MGLAGTKVKQRFGLDPRNTNWSNDTSRFGHQYLESMGWAPGKGLGLVDHAMTTHVKVTIKDDNMGLGAKLGKKKNKDELDNDNSSGLDVFQRILGRLNGKEDKINEELERQRKDNIINGKWGMHFVKGEVLLSTWDSQSKRLSSNQENKKRKKEQDNDEDKLTIQKKKLKSSTHTKEIDDGRRGTKKKKLDDMNEGISKKVKRNKLDSTDGKIEKKEKKEKKNKKEKKDKRENKDKKHKKEKKDRRHKKDEVEQSLSLSPSASGPQVISSRLAVRSRWIRQKRASVMDAKALNEIFMISS